MELLRLRLRGMMVLIALVAVFLAVFVERELRQRPRLLRAGDGPFLVLVHTFRGADADRRARELATELRRGHGLDSYLYAGPSPAVGGGHVAVMVGDAQTLDECSSLRRRIMNAAPRLTTPGGGRGKRIRPIMTVNPESPPNLALQRTRPAATLPGTTEASLGGPGR
jgi:hypothetical protein